MYRVKELMDFSPIFLHSQENEFSFAASRENLEPVVMEEKDIENRGLSHLTKFYLSSTINIPSQASKSGAAICCSQAGEEKVGLRLRSKPGQWLQRKLNWIVEISSKIIQDVQQFLAITTPN